MIRNPVLALAAALGLVIATPAAAPAQTAPAAQAAPYAVKGYRTAVFGMTEAEVLAVVAKDLGVDPKSVKRVVNEGEGTTILSFDGVHIEPMSMPAAVSYIFGASSHRLVHINIIWTTTAGQEEVQRPTLIAMALKLKAYFRGYSWEPKHSLVDVPAGANTVVTFIGQDSSGAVVEVMLQGVGYRRVEDGKTIDAPSPTGPAMLRLAYSQSMTKPDVAKVAPGSF